MQNEQHHHSVNYSVFFLVWIGLIVLTGLTVVVAGTNLGSLSVLTAIAIAAIKTTLVLLFFMHLKYESGLLKLMVIIAVLVMAIFIGFTFFDVSYR